MNSDTSSPVLPSLTAEYLSRHDVQVDNLFSKAWQRIGFKSASETSPVFKAFRDTGQRCGVPFITLGLAQSRLYCDVFKGVATKLLDH